MKTVSIERCSDYQEETAAKAVEQLVGRLGGWGKWIKPGKKVTVKPNLVMAKKPEEAVTAHPSVVKAVIMQIQKAGGVVTIAESPGGPYNRTLLKNVYRSTGIETVADETGAILNFDLRTEKADCEEAKYIKQPEVLKPLADADVIVNLPKLKTHTMMAFSGAVKNMFGSIAGTSKADYHARMPDYKKFADTLIDIYLAVKPTIHLMDAVDAMEGYGPSGGNPRHLGILLASEDGFALDAAAVNIIGLLPERVPVLCQAKERGLLDDEIQYVGEKAENVLVKDYDIPALYDAGVYYNRSAPFRLVQNWARPRPVIHGDICIRCGDCVRNCPPKVITMEKGKVPVIDYNQCIRCFCCHELCGQKAVTIHRNLISKMIMNKRFSGFQ